MQIYVKLLEILKMKEIKKKPKKDLGEMFEPPKKIMFTGTFEQALQACKDRDGSYSRWLMVNVQNVSEFASQELNRDTWSAELVQAIISVDFIFLQTYHNQPEGSRYMSLYKVELSQLPHIGIIDPRTSGLVKSFTGYIEPDDMIQHLSTYLDKYSIKDYTTPIDSKPLAAFHTKLPEPFQRPKIEPTSALVEPVSTTTVVDTAIPTTEQPPVDYKTMESVILPDITSVVPTTEATKVEKIELEPEPAASEPNTTRIQCKLPDGRVQRRFRLTDTVATLYNYYKVLVPEAMIRPFEVILLPNKHLTDLTMTISDAGLSNASITIHFSD